MSGEHEDHTELRAIAELTEYGGPEATFRRLAEAAGGAGVIDLAARLRRVPADADYAEELARLQSTVLEHVRSGLVGADLVADLIAERRNAVAEGNET